MKLSNPDLLKNTAYINGKWVQAKNNKTFRVLNPYDSSLLTEVSDLGAKECAISIEAANEALVSWRSLTANDRSKLLRRWFDLMMENKRDLGIILTMEQGKPLNEAIGEIEYGASFIEWFAEEGKRTYGDVIPSHDSNKRIVTIKQAIGVVAAITPWNFPNSMITRKAGPALAAGCTIVVKPAAATPLSALAIAALAEMAGIPPGVFNVITSSDSNTIGNELTSNKLVRKLSFTGSTKVGKTLIKKCADTVKKVSMELGGNAPFIVFEDADIDKAVEGAIVSKFRNAGQTCVCSNRIFAHEKIYETFSQKLNEEVAKLRVGNGFDKGVDIGPLINQKALEYSEELIHDAIKKGAKLLSGGNRSAEAKNNFIPTILLDVTPEMRLFNEEIFGPIAPIIKFNGEAEVVEMANDTPFGLASYFYGKDMAQIWRVAEALEYGMVGINTGLISTTLAPFGGIKESGFGREGSKYGIDEYLEIKYLCFSEINTKE